MASASGKDAQNGVAVFLSQRLAHATGHDPRGMNALASEPLDDLLAELAQADAVERQLRIFLGDSEDIALRRIGVHAQKQIGRRKVEQAQSVRLRDLRQSEDAAQLVGGGRNAHRQQRVAGLGRGDKMANWADAANARHQRRHFVERTAVAELLEAAKLRNMEAGVFDPAVFVQVERDLRMSFDSRYRIDDDGIALLHDVSLIAMSCEL